LYLYINMYSYIKFISNNIYVILNSYKNNLYVKFVGKLKKNYNKNIVLDVY